MAVQRDKVIASAEKLVAKGKIEPAIKEYERLLDDNPNDVNTLNRIGDLWVRINRNDEAVKVFGKIADHYGRDGFFLKAIAIYKKINKLDPSKLDIYAKLADLYAKQGLAMEAKSQYQVLADYYLKHGDPQNAVAIYKKISELDPNSINVHVKLADLYSQTNRATDALKEYDRVGRMLLKRGMLDEAVQVFKKALKIDSSNIELVESLVTALLEAKDFDNAVQIVQTSIESAPDNARLLAISGRVLLAKGDTRGARAALERALARDANDVSVREALSDLYLRIGNADGALDMLTPVVEKALGRGERGTAVEMLNRILRVDAGHAPTLERLVALYSRLNEETNILSAMSSLAEAPVPRARFENAAEVLENVTEPEPQNAQHRTKLQFVRTQIGGVDTMPARPTRAEVPVAPVSMEIEEPVPSFDSFDEGPALSFDLDASEPLELDLDTGFEPSPPPIAPSPAPPSARTPTLSRLQSAVEMAAADLDGEDAAGEDLDFVTEHLTEAEVFAKYGLTEKATEHLRAIIERAPKHLAAHEKLYRLLLDDGDAAGARAAANQYIAVLQEKGDTSAIENIQDEFLMRGHALQPPAPKLPEPRVPTIERAMPSPLEIEEELSFDLDSGAADFGIPIQEPEPAFSFDLPEPEPAIELPSFEPEPEPALTFEPPAIEEEFSFESQTEQPVFEPEPFIEAPSAEELRELDFYIEQELFDEARQKLDALTVLFPYNAAVAERRSRYDTAMASVTAAPLPPGDAFAPAGLSRDEIESELLSALPDDDEDFFTPAPAPPPPRAAAPPPPPH